MRASRHFVATPDRFALALWAFKLATGQAAPIKAQSFAGHFTDRNLAASHELTWAGDSALMANDLDPHT
jgi:hypothetical protein